MMGGGRGDDDDDGGGGFNGVDDDVGVVVVGLKKEKCSALIRWRSNPTRFCRLLGGTARGTDHGTVQVK